MIMIVMIIDITTTSGYAVEKGIIHPIMDCWLELLGVRQHALLLGFLATLLNSCRDAGKFGHVSLHSLCYFIHSAISCDF